MFFIDNTFRYVIIILYLFFALSHEYVSQRRQRYCPGPCIDLSGKNRKINETWYEDSKCEKHTCIMHRGLPHIRFYRCSVVYPYPECKIERGNGSYPDCCEKSVCGKDSEFYEETWRESNFTNSTTSEFYEETWRESNFTNSTF
uniref:Venom protein n=1 Tax=Hadrurus spadix TaxID=141984 RepID=A0A1W7R935_9SCOR